MSYEVLLERGKSLIIQCKTPVSKYTRYELDMKGSDPDDPENEEASESIIDIGAMSPLIYIRRSNQRGDSTYFVDRAGNSWVVNIDFVEFSRLYFDWLNRNPRLFNEKPNELGDNKH